MRIGFDGGCLANKRGFGRFARRLLEALAEHEGFTHELTVFVDRPSLEHVTIPPRFATHAVAVREAPSQAASASGRRSVRDLLAMSRAVAGASLDLMFFPATYSYFPVWSVKRVVVTMHDTLALAHPEWVFPSWKGRAAWKLKEYVAAHQADRILTVSEAAKRDLVAWFRLQEEAVQVVSEGPDPVFSPRAAGAESDAALARYGLARDSRYLLYVGGLSPHKNLLRLVEAYARALDQTQSDTKLVLVGDTGDVFHTHVPEIRAAIAQHHLGERVLLPGFVPDHDLAFLYSRAAYLVQPSLMEGFGLPPVEALACGTPVLASTAGSLPEVIGDAGLFFEPTDVPAMAATIGRALTDDALRTRLAGLALLRAKRYTWSACAQGVAACFDELLAQGRARTLRRTA